jgi:hypothetical protein
MTIVPSQPSDQAKAILESLRQAVHETLERKQRLGQYAVIWEDGELRLIGGEFDHAAPKAIALSNR